jgi:tetratricopeptide (TPR) repeat protein
VELMQTATAVYSNTLPTATPPASMTPEATQEQTAESTAPAFEPTIASDDNGYDLAALLDQAQTALRLGQYTEAVDLLQVVEAIDPNYERATVRGYMLEALSTQALRIFRSEGNLAEGILLTDEAEQYGLSAESELRFESYVAALYLNAKSKIGTGYPAAIQALTEAYQVAPEYRNGELRSLLFGQYVAYGDAWAIEGNHCAAVGQYQNALNMLNDGGVSAKRNSSQTLCEQGTPVPLPGSEGVAPVGVPATPSN